MIHRIERGVSSPTAALLGRLSGAFRITMSELLRERWSPGQSRLARSHERAVWRDPETNYTRERIAAPTCADKGRAANLDITRIVLPPATKVTFPPKAFNSIRQAIWVKEGRLRFTEGDTVHELGKDDCLTLGAPDHCTFENPTDQPCIYIVILA